MRIEFVWSPINSSSKESEKSPHNVALLVLPLLTIEMIRYKWCIWRWYVWSWNVMEFLCKNIFFLFNICFESCLIIIRHDILQLQVSFCKLIWIGSHKQFINFANWNYKTNNISHLKKNHVRKQHLKKKEKKITWKKKKQWLKKYIWLQQLKRNRNSNNHMSSS